MAGVVDIQEIEPWRLPAFQDDLLAYAAGGRAQSRQYAADARLLCRMAALVPRCDGDTRGATAWTSFLAELAVARRTSSQAAAVHVAEARHLVRLLPLTLTLLEDGLLPVTRARALVEATLPLPDDVAREVDAQLAERAIDLVPSRLRAQVDRIALQHDVDAAAQRSAKAAAQRGTRHTPLPDGQGELALTGPAAVVAQARAALDADARAWLAALRGSGDTRGIDQLRFDLGMLRLTGSEVPLPRTGAESAPAAPAAQDALPDASSPVWWTDRRCSRPVRLDITVPVTTPLGLGDEPGWLAGHGWITAPQVRQLVPVAELRQLCTAAEGAETGQLVDLADQVVRPEPSPQAARQALLRMATEPFAVTDKTWRTEPRHDPSPALDEFVRLRDQHCDGPLSGAPPFGRRADLDHDLPYDHDAEPAAQSGPTAAWNLVTRGRRAHGLKHRGWTALRTADCTLWTSPAGQLVEIPHDPHEQAPPLRALEDPDALHDRERALLTPPELPPWLEAPDEQAPAPAGADPRARGEAEPPF